jgi:hypothetical protein
MRIRVTQAHRFLTGLVAGLSLLLLPVMACVCEKHSETHHPEVALQQHHHHTHAHRGEHEFDAADAGLSHRHECECSGLSSRAIVKAEGVKFQKGFVALSDLPETQNSANVPVISGESESTSGNVLRQQFLTSEPSRGPPLM